MIANEPRPTPFVGVPDATVLGTDAFHHAIVAFVEHQLPVWRDRADRPPVNDEPRLNETLCDHLDCASRHSFDSIRFSHEPYQTPGRAADLAVKPGRHIVVEGVGYSEFEQLLPIECKRLPTPPDKRRSDCEYVHGLPGHRTGAIERFKHGLHGPTNRRALIIAYVQEESFGRWLTIINKRLRQLANNGADNGLWSPTELISSSGDVIHGGVCKLGSRHRRILLPATFDGIDVDHLWMQMN